MFKKPLTILALCIILLGLPIASAMAYEAFHGPTEVTYYDPVKAYNGITIFTNLGGGAWTYMIDMDGRVIHRIHSGGWFTIPLDSGNFLSLVGGSVEELNWSGKVVWSYTPTPISVSEGAIHHDARRIWNTKLKAYTTIFIGSVAHTGPEAQAAGAKGPWITWSPDAITEVDMAGNIVWKWDFFDHLCQNLDATKANYVADVSTKPGRLDVNAFWVASAPDASFGPTSGRLPQDWTHCNSLDYNQDQDLFILNSRNLNEFFVIDHGKTFVSTTNFAANIAAAASSDGDFVYRFGCPSSYNQGDLPGWATNGSTQIWGAHNIQWIRKNEWPQNNWNSPNKGPALPGAGDLLIFNNGAVNNDPLGGASRLLEINPYVNGPPVNGVYPTSPNFVNPPLAGYTGKLASWTSSYSPEQLSNQVVWRFAPLDSCSFSSPFISSVQRLPNGNSFACAGDKGHLFEVTSAGEVVWEYVAPVNGASIVKNAHNISNETNSVLVYRASRWSVSHPAFRNHVIQYSDGTILPVNFNEAGVGFTITGAVPCRNVPCQYVGHP